MVEIKNVAAFGANGDLGTAVLEALVDSKKFNMTVVLRAAPKTSFPTSVNIVIADYTSLDSLTAALKGQDAVVSTVGSAGTLGQKLIIDAAIAAGVKRFLPSEFGSNRAIPKVAAMPTSRNKIAIRKYIEEKIQGGADLTYTHVHNGAFLDWGLETEFIFNWKDGKPKIYDGGERVVSTTTLESVGQAVVGVLTHYEETKNRNVYIQDMTITQNQLLKIAKRVDPARKLEPVSASLVELEKESNDRWAKGDVPNAVVGLLLVALLGEGVGQPHQFDDSKLLGVPGKTEADIEKMFRDLFDGKKLLA